MKIILRGTISKIHEPRTAGTSEITEVCLNKKYHDPDSGELKGEDNYPIQIWTEKLSEFKKCYEISSKMEITGFLNGRLVEKDGTPKCFMNFTAQKFSTIK